MNTATPHREIPELRLLKATGQAAVVAFALAVALSYTSLPLGVRTGLGIFVFLAGQAALMQREIGGRGSRTYWLSVLALAGAAAAVSWGIAEL